MNNALHGTSGSYFYDQTLAGRPTQGKFIEPTVLMLEISHSNRASDQQEVAFLTHQWLSLHTITWQLNSIYPS